MTDSVWPYAEPFVISRGAITHCHALELTLSDRFGNVGRSETYGVPYEGETPASMMAQIQRVVRSITGGIDRQQLLELLPAGGARCAVDLALWDLAAKRGEGDPFARAGLPADPVRTAYTIGIRSNEAYEATARRLSKVAWLKVKVGSQGALEAVRSVRRGAPDSDLIVDPNQAWSIEQLRALAPAMHRLGVRLLEQPIPAGREADLDGYVCPVPICADESLDDVADLPSVRGRFQAINIKLDKVGGLTAAMRLADAALSQGLDLMVGCMGGTSLSMAPGWVLAQRCRYVDLDAPVLLMADREPGFVYRDGLVSTTHIPELWG